MSGEIQVQIHASDNIVSIDNNPTGTYIESADHEVRTVEQPSVSQATSSLQDMQINPQGSHGGVASRIPMIKNIFAPDVIGQLLQQRKCYHAYGVSRKRVKLDLAVIVSKDLVNHYRCCMLVGEAEEAIRTKEELIHLFKEKFETTPNEIETFADTIRGEGRDMEAILFYQIAAEFYGNQSKACLVRISNCACGIKESIKAMLSRDKGLKSIVRTHVIPLMRDMREKIRRSNDVSEEDRCLQEVYCLNWIAISEGLVGYFNGGEKTLEEAIAIIERVFKENAGKYSVYADCLENLGGAYEQTSRSIDACQYYRKAIAAYGKAEKIGNAQRTEKVNICRTNLENAEKQRDTSYVSRVFRSVFGSTGMHTEIRTKPPLKIIQTNPQGSHGEETSQKTTLQDVFSPDNVGQLLQEAKYDQAYGVSRKRIKLDPAVIRCKDLVNHYRCCMLVGEAEEAIRTKDQLGVLIKQNFQATANEIKALADTIGGEGRDMEAILFYQIAAEFYGNQSKTDLVGIRSCVCGIDVSIRAMISRDEGLKPIVRTHVIPLMRDMQEMIRRSDDVSKEERYLEEVDCSCQIGVSEYYVGDLDSVEKTLKEAIAIMDRVFKENAGKYSVYAACLYNLGHTYMNTSRLNDACQCFLKSIAYGKAEDLNDDERAEWIGSAKTYLNQCEKQRQLSVSQATSSLQDNQVSPQGSQSGVKSIPKFKDIFGAGYAGRSLQKRNYYNAYIISRKRIYDPVVIRSKNLVNSYRCCMLVGETEEAIQIKEQLMTILKDKFETTANEIKTFADTIRGEGRDMEAILFYQIAAEFYRNQTKACLVGISDCAWGMKESIRALLSRDKGLKPIVRTHVIPLMRDMREIIRRSDDVSEEERCLQEVECLCQIGVSEYLVGDLDVSEKTLKEAIAIMQRVFKEKAVKYEVCGQCLNNLGYTYGCTSRPIDACLYYRKAIAAYGKAEKIGNDQRAEKVNICRTNLENAEKQRDTSYVSRVFRSVFGSTGMHTEIRTKPSMRDIQTNRKGSRGGKETSQKPTPIDVLVPDSFERLLQERKYNEAYGVSKKRLRFNLAVIGSKDLVNHYRCCMLVGEAEEAIRTKDQLKMGEGRDMEAILFYQIAAEFYGNQTKECLVGISNCAKGITESIVVMIKREKRLKPMVRIHVVPLMRDMREMIRRSDDVSEEDRCLQEVWCLYYIEYSEYLLGDWIIREKTLEEAIAIMERVFKDRAGNYLVYAACLYNLGEMKTLPDPTRPVNITAKLLQLMGKLRISTMKPKLNGLKYLKTNC
uniref:uncharacterized protein LOC108949958 n=1 Tax=Ciona intestinalis TaxID=7719 RepID=UPI000EF4C9D3|nr:uncharacterized protein LOC108949958 [Ciona intestinalis]|eukprot:XP_026692798.1 uncharacterized protein LOC108949958 [Ciona intestinalis]